MLNDAVLMRLDDHRQAFNQARPFRHLAIDDFFDPGIAEQLLAQFPAFDEKYARNEFGEVGNKAVVTDIAALGEAYERTYAYLNSQDFLDRVSRLTGIPDLLPDPDMYGGGTHENREGQNLYPHVDFNYSQDRSLHRRLNILLYLNKEWEEDWGGCIQLHSNPRDPERDEVKTFLPLFNRAVIFETNEHSWHGFRTIRLPEGKKHLTRKCLSIYLYTRERPAQEIAPEHGTFYVQEPLPDHLRPGHALNGEDVEELKQLLKERDDFILHYQKMELEKNRIIEEGRRYRESISAGIRLPITGYVLQRDAAAGYWHDHWVAERFEARLRAKRPVEAVTLHGFVPEQVSPGYDLSLTLGGERFERRLAPGGFSLRLTPRQRLQGEFRLSVSVPREQIEAAALEPDGRPLIFLLSELEFHHEEAEAAGQSLLAKAKGLLGRRS